MLRVNFVVTKHLLILFLLAMNTQYLHKMNPPLVSLSASTCSKQLLWFPNNIHCTMIKFCQGSCIFLRVKVQN